MVDNQYMCGTCYRHVLIIQPGINKPLGCLIGVVPFEYQIITILGDYPLIDKPGFIDPQLSYRKWGTHIVHISRIVPSPC